MNNLCISCENVILKLVEEDIVFSMNIEKLRFENVNEDWVQTITGKYFFLYMLKILYDFISN